MVEQNFRFAAPLADGFWSWIAHAPQQPVGDARRAARAARDLEAAFRVERHVEEARRAAHDLGELFGAVELEPGDDAEAVAQRVGQQAPRASSRRSA